MRRTAEDIIEIGRGLIEAKRMLPHGRFLPWIEKSFEMSERWAQNAIRIAERFEKTAVPADLGYEVLTLLAAPSTPETAVAAVAEAAREETIGARRRGGRGPSARCNLTRPASCRRPGNPATWPFW